MRSSAIRRMWNRTKGVVLHLLRLFMISIGRMLTIINSPFSLCSIKYQITAYILSIIHSCAHRKHQTMKMGHSSNKTRSSSIKRLMRNRTPSLVLNQLIMTSGGRQRVTINPICNIKLWHILSLLGIFILLYSCVWHNKHTPIDYD